MKPNTILHALLFAAVATTAAGPSPSDPSPAAKPTTIITTTRARHPGFQGPAHRDTVATTTVYPIAPAMSTLSIAITAASVATGIDIDVAEDYDDVVFDLEADPAIDIESVDVDINVDNKNTTTTSIQTATAVSVSASASTSSSLPPSLDARALTLTKRGCFPSSKCPLEPSSTPSTSSSESTTTALRPASWCNKGIFFGKAGAVHPCV